MALVEQIHPATTIEGVRDNQKIGLDHVGFAGSVLEPMRAEWQALGFSPTVAEELRAVDAAGVARSLGQRSCHIVFERGYIELTEVIEPSPTHHLAPWLIRGPGLHILAFGTPDVAAWRTHGRRVGSARLGADRARSRSVNHGAVTDPSRLSESTLHSFLTAEAAASVRYGA